MTALNALQEMTPGSLLESNVDYRLTDRARGVYVKEFCEECHGISDERRRMKVPVTTWNQKTTEINGILSGHNDCVMKLEIRTA
ncbi:MAG: hypothetical protein QNK92_10510 [Amylibacter sp.]